MEHRFQLALLGANLLVCSVALVVTWQSSKALEPMERDVTEAIDRLKTATDRADSACAHLASIGEEWKQWKDWKEQVVGSVRSLDERTTQLAADTKILAEELKQWKDWKEQVVGSVRSLDERTTQLAADTNILAETMRPRKTADELRAAVADAEAHWLPQSRPAKLPAESDELRADIAELELALPQGESAAYASSIRTLAWWADAIDLIAAAPAGGRNSLGALEESQGLIETAPWRVPDWAYDALNGVRAREILRVAVARIEDSATTVDELDALKSSLSSVRDSLSESDRSSLDQMTQRLDGQRKQAEVVALSSEYDMLQASWRSLESRADLGADLLVQALSMTNVQLLQLVIEAVDKQAPLAKEAAGTHARWSAEITKVLKRTMDVKHLAYQRWALKKIDSARKRFEVACGIDDDEEAIKNALIEELVPINQAELEPPIHQDFQNLWSDMNAELDAKRRQKVLEAVSQKRQVQVGDV
jgi:uncharacterized phage infection (PIP) family protein YhgE